MKKFLCILLLLSLLLLCAAGCMPSIKSNSVLPPVRIGKGSMLMHLVKDYSFESAFESADAVVRAEIGNWLGEDNEIFNTYYETTVLECFKGSIPETFTLLQEGSSACTQEGYPLYTAGNELLLFLYEATDVHGYESVYWIAGAFVTTMDVTYDAEGDRYYADRYGILCRNFSGYCWNYALNKAEAEKLRAYLYKVDPFMKTMGFPYTYIYAEDALEEYMAGL